MDTTAVLQDLGAYGGAFVVCLISGFFPLINCELFFIGLVAALTPSHPEIALIVLAGTAGQMLSKVVTYWGVRGASNLSLSKYKERLEKWRHRFARSGPGLWLLISASAVFGLPPLFVVTILAGVFKVPFFGFLVVGTAGRYLRFGAVAWSPTLVMSYL